MQRVALVTGEIAGIGTAICQQLAAKKVTVSAKEALIKSLMERVCLQVLMIARR